MNLHYHLFRYYMYKKNVKNSSVRTKLPQVGENVKRNAAYTYLRYS